jgi:hypothetical protein
MKGRQKRKKMAGKYHSEDLEIHHLEHWGAGVTLCLNKTYAVRMSKLVIFKVC